MCVCVWGWGGGQLFSRSLRRQGDEGQTSPSSISLRNTPSVSSTMSYTPTHIHTLVFFFLKTFFEYAFLLLHDPTTATKVTCVYEQLHQNGQKSDGICIIQVIAMTKRPYQTQHSKARNYHTKPANARDLMAKPFVATIMASCQTSQDDRV